jgi:hypothetical protein
MVLIEHGGLLQNPLPYGTVVLPVQPEFFYHGFAQFKLHQADHGIIENAFEFRRDIIPYFLRIQILYGSDAQRFDKDLVNHRNIPQHAPCGTVVFCFLDKNIPALVTAWSYCTFVCAILNSML